MKIVYLRFGTLVNPDVTQIQMSTGDISRQLRIACTSIRNILKRFIDRGCTIEALVEKRSRRFERVLPPYAQEFLLKSETLQQWQPFSIKERCLILLRLFGLQISFSSLQKFYQLNNIRYLTAGRCYDVAIRKRDSLND